MNLYDDFVHFSGGITDHSRLLEIGEALAVLPNILNLGMVLKFYVILAHLSFCFLCSS